MMSWTSNLPPSWESVRPAAVFRERREASTGGDEHLTPSQHYGVLTQAEYMTRTGTKLVLNLMAPDKMKHVEPNDFIAHLRSFQGGIEKSDLRGKVSTAYTVIEPLPSANPRFFRWVLKSAAFVAELAASCEQLRDGQSVKFDDFARIRLPLPPKEEQLRIADFLDDRIARVDRIISARRFQQKSAEELPWSAFSEKLTSLNAPPAPLRRSIRQLADGPFGSAFSSSDYVDAGPGVIRLGNIGFAEFRGTDIARVPDEIYGRFPTARVRSGDLLIASLGDARNHAGRACVAPVDLGPAMVKGKCYVAQADRDNSSEAFLAILLSSPLGAEQLVAQGSGATRSMLNFDRLLSTALPLPPLDAQSRLVAEFQEARHTSERALSHLRLSISLLQEFRQSLIAGAVTGVVDVTTARSRISG